ncbi:MAG: hypothetical protein RL328_2307 [Acidobacteriota bacterium]
MVRQAIEAALAQSLAPIEVCVSDDCSGDATWSTLTAMAESDFRVRVFRQETNSGGVENWNFAIRQTKGQYIAWCSDDDRFLPEHLDASVHYLERHPDVGLVHAGFVDAVETEDHQECTDRPLRFPRDTVLDRDSLLTYLTRYYDWPFHPSTIVMRRTVWEQVGPFDPKYALADTDWFARAVERFPAALLARHGVLNRRHAGNWSNRLGSARMQAEIRAIVEASIDRLFPREPMPRWTWKLIWRTNVRLRLLLTAWARLQSGHAQAAAVAWTQALSGVFPSLLVNVTSEAVRRAAGRRSGSLTDARQSVSPL